MKYYAGIKRNEALIHDSTWMNLENMLSKGERPVTNDNILFDFIYLKCPEEANTERQKID